MVSPRLFEMPSKPGVTRKPTPVSSGASQAASLPPPLIPGWETSESAPYLLGPYSGARVRSFAGELQTRQGPEEKGQLGARRSPAWAPGRGLDARGPEVPPTKGRATPLTGAGLQKRRSLNKGSILLFFIFHFCPLCYL